MNQIPGKLRRRLSDALVDAFTEASLARCVRDRLDERLETLVGGGNLRDKVHELLGWAERQGRVGELVKAAAAEVPGNEKLRGARAAFRAFLDERAEPPQRPAEEVKLLAEVRRDSLGHLEKYHKSGLPLISLARRWRLDAVDNPRTRTLPEGEADVPTFAVLEEETAGELLILGEAGSGKSMELVELTHRAADAAAADPERPIPVMAYLDRWVERKPGHWLSGLLETLKRSATFSPDRARNREPPHDPGFTEWLCGELERTYGGTTRERLREWIKVRKLLPLLDQLDALERSQRERCIEAINSFVRETSPPGLVVCCRSREYEESSVRLELRGALELQPVPDAEVDGLLGAAGARVSVLREAWRRDPAWRELLSSPLFLEYSVSAFPAAAAAELESSPGSTADLRRLVFDRYVDRAFERPGQLYPRPRAEAWLGFLARRLAAHRREAFFIDELQPSWLGSAGERRLYALATSTAAGFLVGLVTWEPAGMVLGALSGLGVGAVDAWHLGSGRRRGGWRYVLQVAGVALALGATLGFVGYEMVPSLLVAAALAVLFLLQGHGRGLDDDVRPVDRLALSVRGALWGLLPGLLLVVASLTLKLLGWGLVSWFVFWFLAVPSALLGALIGGLRGQAKKAGRTRPNQGIFRSALLAPAGLLVLVPALYPLVLGLSWGAWHEGFGAALSQGIFLLPFAVVMALALGGLEVIRHWALRLTLGARGRLPWRLERFLEAQAANALLVRRGPAYSFHHSYLRDHFRDRPQG